MGQAAQGDLTLVFDYEENSLLRLMWPTMSIHALMRDPDVKEEFCKFDPGVLRRGFYTHQWAPARTPLESFIADEEEVESDG